MPFEYISTEDAIHANGLRMVVVSNVPSPWGEAAKGILHMKSIQWKAVRLVYDSPVFDEWAKEQSAPIAFFGDEAPRYGWREILERAEAEAPNPSLIARDADTMFALCHDFMGENGLGWVRRLQMVEAGLKGEGGFIEPVAKFIGHKYGYSPEAGVTAEARVVELLTSFADRLMAQKAGGSDYYLGDAPSAVDIYSAAIMAMFAPLPEASCAMKPATRGAFETLNVVTKEALQPVLLAHRDMMYERHLELPLSL